MTAPDRFKDGYASAEAHWKARWHQANDDLQKAISEIERLRYQHQGQGEHIVALRTEVDRLTALADRNGVRWCLCSRADRIHDRAQPDCPHHGTPMHQQRDHAHARLAAVEDTITTHAREYYDPARRVRAVPVDTLRAALETDTTKETP